MVVWTCATEVMHKAPSQGAWVQNKSANIPADIYADIAENTSEAFQYKRAFQGPCEGPILGHALRGQDLCSEVPHCHRNEELLSCICVYVYKYILDAHVYTNMNSFCTYN